MSTAWCFLSAYLRYFWLSNFKNMIFIKTDITHSFITVMTSGNKYEKNDPGGYIRSSQLKSDIF